MRVVNTCRLHQVGAPFQPLLEPVCSAYLNLLGPQGVSEIRLLGSVPRGEARVGLSDIDFVALVEGEVPSSAAQALQVAAADLGARFPQVRRVDLEFEVRASLSPTRAFILATDSLALHGADSYGTPEVDLDPEALAALVTPNLDALLAAYREGVGASCDVTSRLQHSLWIGKDLLKALRRRLILERQQYAKSAREISRLLSAAFPEDRDLVARLWTSYEKPDTDAVRMHELLDAVAQAAPAYR